MFVEDHGLTVLAAHVKDGFAVRMVVAGTGNMGRDFADTEIIRDEVGSIFNDLTAGDDRAVDALQTGNACILKELVNRLAELSEVACTSLRTDAGATDSAGVRRTGTLVDGLTHFAPLVHQNRLEGG